MVVETGGVDYLKVELPRRCLLILGSEELGVSPEFLEDQRIISIPMFGRKVSINVGVSFGILAAYWRSQF
jgi:TrmH family RNA methyltransferase